MTLKYIWRSFQLRLSFPRPFQLSLACFRVTRSPSNSCWASCIDSQVGIIALDLSRHNNLSTRFCIYVGLQGYNVCWQLSSNGSTSPGTPDMFSPPVQEWTFSNPEMEIFRQRRLAQQNQPKHRLSLADLITDWPSLEYIEKPEYRMPEVKRVFILYYIILYYIIVIIRVVRKIKQVKMIWDSSPKLIVLIVVKEKSQCDILYYEYSILILATKLTCKTNAITRPFYNLSTIGLRTSVLPLINS